MPNNDRFYAKYEDRAQKKKDEQVSKIADADNKLEQNSSERDRRNAKNNQKKKNKRLKNLGETELVAALKR